MFTFAEYRWWLVHQLISRQITWDRRILRETAYDGYPIKLKILDNTLNWIKALHFCQVTEPETIYLVCCPKFVNMQLKLEYKRKRDDF
jgi:hypothetical protein